MHTYIYKYICYNKIEIYFFSVIFLKFSSFRFTPILYAAANYLQTFTTFKTNLSTLYTVNYVPLLIARRLLACLLQISFFLFLLLFLSSPSLNLERRILRVPPSLPHHPPSRIKYYYVQRLKATRNKRAKYARTRAYIGGTRNSVICVFTYSVRVYGFSSARRSSKSPPSLALALSLSATARLRRMNTVWNRFVNEMGWRCIAVQLPLSLSLPLPPPSLLSFDRSS